MSAWAYWQVQRPLISRPWSPPHSVRNVARLAAIVCGDMVARKKPAPDIYELLLSTLRVLPGAAVAFEDSTNGVLAAKAAVSTRFSRQAAGPWRRRRSQPISCSTRWRIPAIRSILQALPGSENLILYFRSLKLYERIEHVIEARRNRAPKVAAPLGLCCRSPSAFLSNRRRFRRRTQTEKNRPPRRLPSSPWRPCAAST